MKRHVRPRVSPSPRLRVTFLLLLAPPVAFSSGCVVRGGSEAVAPDVPDDCPYPLHGFDEIPVMNLPLEARCKNYNGGSCVCASTISCLRWQGRDDLAQQVREICSGGQSSGSLHAKLDRLGIRYASTTSGDVKLLEWAVRTRRGSGITFYGNHFVNLVHLDAEKAMLLDNNRTGQYITIPRDEFIRRWQGQYGGWATVPVYSPAPPLPFVGRR